MENASRKPKLLYNKIIIVIGVFLFFLLFIVEIVVPKYETSLNLWYVIWKCFMVVIIFLAFIYVFIQKFIRMNGRLIGLFHSNLFEEQRIESEQRYRELFENNLDSAFLLDTEGRFVEVNRMGSIITGYANEELIGKSFMPNIPNEELPKVLKWFETVLRGEPIRFETKWIHKQGHVVDINVTAMPVFQNEKLTGVFSFTRDITEQKRYQQEMKDLAYKDSLTKLSNRRSFLENLESKLREARNEEQKFAVLYIDLDSLKMINDYLGHEAGDQVLQLVSEKLLQCLNNQGVVSRIGGDEFGIIIPNVKTEDCVIRFAKEVLTAFDEGFPINSHKVQCGASIGIVLYPAHGDNVKTLMKNADTAMYSVKKTGKNNYQVYEPGLATRTSEGFHLQQDFGQEILEEGQFFLVYQPRIDSISKRVVAVEALLRWNHPVKGLIPPQIFIPLAEENGFINKLGEWVLQKACQQLKKWKEIGVPPLRMAVNVSARQFERGNLSLMVENTLKQWDIEPSFLEIEITESTLMNENEKILASIESLHQKGIHISIDDFGKGYSSLSYLKNFKINMLKIDKLFIRNVHENNENASITQAIISLAHTMNIRVVAEGVEQKEEMDYLVDSMVDEIQGYYICRPLPAEEVYKLFFIENDCS
jgi:diguanylate cyclase (GGDEF)-like protein/PAS domain S-box-containing protein